MISGMSLDLLKALGEAWEKKSKKSKTKSMTQAENIDGMKDTWTGTKEGTKENALAFARAMGGIK
jgi:hypothetical protein